MDILKECEFVSSLKFFDLLLEQFKGVEGELPSAITYLTQATNEVSETRRDSLIRIARGKLKNSNMIASILLQVSKGKSGPVSCRVRRREFDRFLPVTNLLREAYDPAPGSHIDLTTESVQIENRFRFDPIRYLSANIISEKKQIAIYARLVDLTKEPAFKSALNYVRARQILHRDEFVFMLHKLKRENLR